MNCENSDDEYLLRLGQKPLSEIPQYEKSTQKNAFLYSQKIITGKKQAQFASIETPKKMEVVIMKHEHAKKVSYDFY